MAFELTLFDGGFNQDLIQKQAVNDVMKYNGLTAKYGLILSERQAAALVKTRSLALQQTGRVEFGGGVIDKIIFAFCDSPFISMQNYENALHELVEIFYNYKNETLDLISDDELISHMEKAFNGICQGSLDLLSGRELDTLARNLRFGRPAESIADANLQDREAEDEKY